MSHNKTISVAMCTYNGEKFLREQLESIAAQTRLPNELVICDDKSTDSTVDILQSFAASAPFPVRIRINPVNIGGSSKGITKNFEATTLRCTGDLIVPCDQDDIWSPQKLEYLARTMEENSQLGGVFSDAHLINDLGERKGVLLSQTAGLTLDERERLSRGDILPVLLSMTKVYGCTLMFDARFKEKILPVPPHWWFDAWVACMVAVHAKLEFVPEPLFSYRIHSTQSVGASLPTMSDKVRRWKRSSKEYWKEAEPQLTDLYSRLAAEKSSNMERHLEYIRGRMDLLRFRAELPSNPVTRVFKVISKTSDYHRYFNGWRSLVKDLTA